MAKYDPLVRYLTSSDKKKLRLTFDQIEEIIDAHLPASATTYRGWWSGNSATWVYEGWRAIPNVHKKRVGFVKDRTAKRLRNRRLASPAPQRTEPRR